ncbi:hypothetical protein AAKU58_000422 [Oxalobacteraceae bacterium GrIS 1.18]
MQINKRCDYWDCSDSWPRVWQVVRVVELQVDALCID